VWAGFFAFMPSGAPFTPNTQNINHQQRGDAMLEQQILKEALTLAPKGRASLIEKLLASLDQPDKAIDELWTKEAENRIDAYEAGNIKVISAEQVFGKYKK
jgi:putative addiction module component (TIGR02574 family)